MKLLKAIALVALGGFTLWIHYRHTEKVISNRAKALAAGYLVRNNDNALVAANVLQAELDAWDKDLLTAEEQIAAEMAVKMLEDKACEDVGLTPSEGPGRSRSAEHHVASHRESDVKFVRDNFGHDDLPVN